MSYNNSGRSNNYRGGGRSGGRGRGRSGGGRSGGGNNYNNNNGGRGGGNEILKAAIFGSRICQNYASSGQCKYGDRCMFSHFVKQHASIDASSVPPHQNQNQNRNNNGYNNNNSYNNNKVAPISSIAVWEVPGGGGIKIFTGSHDGYWRLWNTAGGNFGKEFESPIAAASSATSTPGKVEKVVVCNNFLFCGFEAASAQLPQVPVGMVHAWNLQQPNQPPLELLIHPTNQLIPYAHNRSTTALTIAGEGVEAKIASGSHDGSIRVWGFHENSFQLMQTMAGHTREVTGLVLLPQESLLWSSGMDGAIRIWDLKTGACQYCITPSGNDVNAANPQQQLNPPQASPQTAGAGVGHSKAVTDLISFQSPPPHAGTFILSSSLDGTVKAWDATSGACVATEANGEGVVCMSIGQDAQGAKVLLLGLESGSIAGRNLVQQQHPTNANITRTAFQLLFATENSHAGHVNAITSGPAGTFYSGGTDGKMNVYQITGDMMSK